MSMQTECQEWGHWWLDVGVRAKARVVSLGCGVRGKGESRKWGREIHSAQGTLSRGVRIVRAKRRGPPAEKVSQLRNLG